MKNNKIMLGVIISAFVPSLHWLLLEFWSRDKENQREDTVFGMVLDTGEGSGETTVMWYDFGIVPFFVEFFICFLCFTAVHIIKSKMKSRKKA